MVEAELGRGQQPPGQLADGGKTLTANGAVVNNATHSGAGKISLTGGSGSHSLSGTGVYGNLELNDANGASIASGTSTVNGTLAMTSGTLSSGGVLYRLPMAQPSPALPAVSL